MVYLPPLIAILVCLKAERSSNGLVVQLVRIPACHAGGREFESRPDRFYNVVLKVLINVNALWFKQLDR